MQDISLILKANNVPLFAQIFDYFKGLIQDGVLLPGMPLPSIRKCADALGVSKNTVESAYQLLRSEGYVVSHAQKGYTVIPSTLKSDTNAGTDKTKETAIAEPLIHIDFKYGNLEFSSFPLYIWNKLRNEWIDQYGAAFEVQGDPHGELALREEIIRLLHQARGVQASPEQVIIGATPQQLVMLLCQILNRDETVIAVENPGYDGSRHSFENYGFHVKGIPLQEDGIDIQQLQQSVANIVYVSTSQQFQNKLVMPLSKRMELAAWVEADRTRYLIEDDYEWEFKYMDTFIPSIQSRNDTGQVVYVGSISKSILPLFSLSYMILPSSLLKLFKLRIPEYDQPVSRLDQLTYASFLEKGYWYKHLQKLRDYYRHKKSAFDRAMEAYMGNRVIIHGKDTGLHLFVTVLTDLTEQQLIQRALENGVKVYGTTRYWINPPHDKPTILLGFGSLEDRQIEEGIRILAESWFPI